MNVLIFTPPPRNGKPIIKMFRQHGVRVDHCETAETCCTRSMTTVYDAVVYLDFKGSKQLIPFFTRWKSEGCTSHFIVISDNQSGFERGRALEIGVDSYHIEPCSYSQLILEIAAQVMRRQLRQPQSLQTNYFSVDLLSRTIHYLDSPIQLSRTEFSLLVFLIQRRGIVLSRLQLWEEAWDGRGDYPVGNTVDVHIGRIRRKLGGSSLISCVHGIGYRIRADC